MKRRQFLKLLPATASATVIAASTPQLINPADVVGTTDKFNQWAWRITWPNGTGKAVFIVDHDNRKQVHETMESWRWIKSNWPDAHLEVEKAKRVA